MKSNTTEDEGYKLEEFESHLNSVLSRSYNWFHDISINKLEYNSHSNLRIDGDILVDGNWFYNQYKEYHYFSNVPDPNLEKVFIGDIIGKLLADEIRNKIRLVYGGVTQRVANVISFNTLYVSVFEEDDQSNKDILKESIKKILREEITKKFPKPNESFNNSVYSWLNYYFQGSQIYKEEYWKYHGFSFKFCKNGREIADLRVELDDKSPDWGPSDKRPTSERSFKEVMLYIYPIMVDLMMNVFPIRKNYLLYLIEEWFEDTKLNEIQQEFNRNDLSLDYVSVFEHRKKGDICVPPISKPEDITMEEMMDYIKKNSLFSYKDMEEYEEEEPGWIENMYLGKLNAKEQERLNQEDRDNNPEPFNDGY